jgi:hypothetical protein
VAGIGVEGRHNRRARYASNIASGAQRTPDNSDKIHPEEAQEDTEECLGLHGTTGEHGCRRVNLGKNAALEAHTIAGEFGKKWAKRSKNLALEEK